MFILFHSHQINNITHTGSSYIDHRESASKANGGSDHWCFVTTLRTGVSADECTSSPCGSGQTCKDLSLANTGDFTCTCKPEFGSISSYGSSAICELDECTLPGMCKELFSCTDRNTSIASRDDVTCSCRSADCKSRDECKNSPCGIDQTCMDPTFNLTKGDFVCTCNPQFGSISSIGQQAVCEYDECGLYPCTAGQTCNDANTSVASLNDFSCSGGMPPVSADECLMTPCGANQVCVEVNNTISGDFICRCSTTVGNIASIGSPAVCTYDECLTTPCSTGQACQDANESIASLGDFVCTNTSSISNECEPSPCGVGQMCIDSDWSMAGDFICKCDMSLGNIASIGSSAFCTFDECTNNPCPSGKTCTDSNSSTASLGDYTCSNSGSVVNECVATPCSAGQTCSDPDWAVSKNFICMCGADALNIAAIGMDAICTLDECQNNPCSGSQTCVDTNTSITSLGDFTCSSSSSSVDECLSSPCGGSQSCSDPNMTTSGDFICRCDPSSGNIAAFAAPAMCTFDECQNNPCPTGQSCTDGNTSTISLGDYSCSNSQSVLNECLAGPCASGQTCSDPDWSTPRDFICKCGAEIGNVAAVGASASCVFDECQSTPCSVGQTCLDANMSVASLGNYACSGSQAGTDECSTSPCDAGQMCTDLDTSSSGNYICKCPGKFGSQIASVGQSASCTYDECGLSPCMMGETCADKNISSSSLGDFTCSGSTSVDECASSPCDSQQECSDMNKNSDLDFICKCPTQFGNIAAIGSAAVCSYDECSTTPCPSPQLCTDLNQSIASIGDFSCRSASDSFDECQTTPCGDGQGCSDPNLKQTGDYKCTCTSISLGTSTVGKPANCSINECISTPCGAKQMCEDNNMLMMNDYTCSCMNTTYGDMMVSGKPANCSFDECTKSPCGVSQTCNDPNEEIYLDFTCTCDMSLGLISETGKEALCVTNECNTFPCESDEACLDKNISSVSMKDFMCVKQSSTTNMLDECSLGICPDDQTCMDPDMTQSYDFECTCHQDYGLVNATGKAAICMMDECESKPCGNDSCKDSNMSVVSLNDFVCSKMNESNPYCKGTTCTDCAVHSTYLKTLLNLDQSDATLVVPGTVTCPDTAALAASAPSNSSGDDSKEKVYLIILIVEAVLLFIALAALAYKCMSGNKITDDGSFDHDSMLPTNNWEELSQPPSPAHSSSRQLITL